MTPIFLTAQWRKLVMINFPTEERLLREHVPPGTEIDHWRGTTWISLVGFRFLDTKVRGIAIPFHRNFEEINLRFYVRSRGPQGWRRGVVFLREVVPRRAIAAVARWVYGESYVACPTRSILREPSAERAGRAEYRWRNARAWLTVGAEYAGDPRLPPAGSEAEFITEHYWGYVARRRGGTLEYRVDHPQWRLWEASRILLDGDLVAFYGQAWAAALRTEPSSAFVAEGSAITVRRGEPIDVRGRESASDQEP